MYQIQHALFARLREILLHIEFADGLTQHTAHRTHGTLPARAILCLTTHHAVKSELHGPEIVAHHTRRTRDQLDLRIRLQIVERSLSQNLLHLVDRLGLTHVDQFEIGESGNLEHAVPVDAREVGLQLAVGHLMVVLVDVPQFHGAVAHLGDAVLDGHHGVHLLLGGHRVVAHHLEERLHILLICLTHTHRLLIVVQIVVTVTHTETALSY